MKLCRIAAAMAAVLSLASPAFALGPTLAAENAAWGKALELENTPGSGQARLEPMIGAFDVEIRIWVDPKKAPVISQGSSINNWVLGKRYIQTNMSASVQDQPWNGIGYIGYDNASRTYQVAWMEDGTTAMTWYHGGFDSSGKATLKATVSSPLTGKPTPVELRFSIAENGDHVTQLWGQGLGRTMFKMMELHYTRSKK